jgi:hypothetical protein
MTTRAMAVVAALLWGACSGGNGKDPGGACLRTGGKLGAASCCAATGDYPDTCATGACGCAPDASVTVKTCSCPTDECFDPLVGCR